MLELIKAILASLVAETNEIPQASASLPTDSILTMIDSIGADNG